MFVLSIISLYLPTYLSTYLLVFLKENNITQSLDLTGGFHLLIYTFINFFTIL